VSSVAILDYGIGNIRSMFNAVKSLGESAVVTSDKTEIMGAKALIVPGVGSFNKGMQNLTSMGHVETINEFRRTGKTLLGVCLGMQLLVDKGDEGGACAGLGLILGSVRKIELQITQKDRIPHVGWNSLLKIKTHATRNFFNGVHERAKFYFVHSYAVCETANENILCVTRYGTTEIVAGITKENITGLQFHPEKSGVDGLQLLKNIIKE